MVHYCCELPTKAFYYISWCCSQLLNLPLLCLPPQTGIHTNLINSRKQQVCLCLLLLMIVNWVVHWLYKWQATTAPPGSEPLMLVSKMKKYQINRASFTQERVFQLVSRHFHHYAFYKLQLALLLLCALYFSMKVLSRTLAPSAF